MNTIFRNVILYSNKKTTSKPSTKCPFSSIWHHEQHPESWTAAGAETHLKKTIMATRSEKATTAVCRPSYGRREVSVFVAASLNVSSGCNFAEVSAAALQGVSHSVIYCWWLRVRKNSDMEEGLDVNMAWSSLHTDCWLCLATHFDGRVALRYIMSKQAAAPLNFRLHNLNVAHIVTPLFFYAKTTDSLLSVNQCEGRPHTNKFGENNI